MFYFPIIILQNRYCSVACIFFSIFYSRLNYSNPTQPVGPPFTNVIVSIYNQHQLTGNKILASDSPFFTTVKSRKLPLYPGEPKLMRQSDILLVVASQICCSPQKTHGEIAVKSNHLLCAQHRRKKSVTQLMTVYGVLAP